MFRWCSFCETFLGESEPRDNYSLTHGICPECKARVKSGGAQKAPAASLALIKSYFERLREAVILTAPLDERAIVREASELEIHPADLLAGIMQPLLYEIGKLYAKGKVTVTQEHRFSTMIKALIHALKEAQPGNECNDGSRPVDVLLSCADGNYHEFGVLFLEFRLQQLGLKVESLTPGLPASELVEHASRVRARVLGISISMPEQLQAAAEAVAALRRTRGGYQPPVLVGGLGARGLADDAVEGATVFHGSVHELVAQLLKIARAA